MRGGGGGQGKGRERGEEDWTASPASREQVAEFFLGSPSPARCGLCRVPGCPGDELNHSSSWPPEGERGIVRLSET